MTQDWQDCPTMKSVVEAIERKYEIEWLCHEKWIPWHGRLWESDMKFRCRPAKKTKTVTLDEIAISDIRGTEHRLWVVGAYRIRYTGNERIEEVPYE